MTRYLLRRGLQGVVVLWLAFTIAFAVLYVIPGDPVAIMIGQDSTPTPEELAAVRAKLGLDVPLWQQYLNRFFGMFVGDFGTSYSYGGEVSKLISDAFMNTLVLTITGTVLGGIVGVVVGAVAAAYVSPRRRRLFSSFSPLAASLPSFWIGILLIQLFSFRLGWLPAAGDAGIAALILPAITLSVPVAATVAQVLTQSLSDTLHEPWVDVLRAKGVPRRRILVHHVLRNAAIPPLTVWGLYFGTTFGYSMIVETVFSRPGIGRLIVVAVSTRDIPLVLGVTMVCAAILVVVTVAIDLLYPVINPRIRLELPA